MPSDERKDEEMALRAWAKVESNVRVVLASSNVEVSLESHERPQGGIYAKGIGSVLGTSWRPREIRSAAEFEEVVLGALRTPPSPEDRALALTWYAGLEAAGRPTATPPAPEVTEAMVEALEAKKYQPPLPRDQSIWNAAINTAIEVVKSTAAHRGGDR